MLLEVQKLELTFAHVSNTLALLLLSAAVVCFYYSSFRRQGCPHDNHPHSFNLALKIHELAFAAKVIKQHVF